MPCLSSSFSPSLSITPSLSLILSLVFYLSLSPKLFYSAHLLKSTATKHARENVVPAVSPWSPLAPHCTHANAAHCALVCLCLIAKCNCLLSLMLMLMLSQLLLLLLLFLTWPTCALLDIRFTFLARSRSRLQFANRQLAFTHFSFTCRRTTEKKGIQKKEQHYFFVFLFSNCFHLLFV